MRAEAGAEAVDGGMAAHPVSDVTFLFGDIVCFTELTERVGDAIAHRVVKGCQAAIEEQVERFGGRLLELRGDGFLIAFDSPPGAVSCSAAIQRMLLAMPGQPIRMRMGLHSGPAIYDEGRYFGRTVIAAFRVSSLACAGEVLLSAETKRRLPPRCARFGPEREVALRGFRRRTTVLELLWWRARRGSLAGETAPVCPAVTSVAAHRAAQGHPAPSASGP